MTHESPRTLFTLIGILPPVSVDVPAVACVGLVDFLTQFASEDSLHSVRCLRDTRQARPLVILGPRLVTSLLMVLGQETVKLKTQTFLQV